MDPVSLLGGKKFHQSAQRFSSAGGAGGWKEERGLEYDLGDHQLEGRRGAHKTKGRERKSKGKDGSGP
jgi:hypothetical protein